MCVVSMCACTMCLYVNAHVGEGAAVDCVVGKLHERGICACI